MCLRARNVRRKHILNISNAHSGSCSWPVNHKDVEEQHVYNAVHDCNVMNVIDFLIAGHDVTGTCH